MTPLAWLGVVALTAMWPWQAGRAQTAAGSVRAFDCVSVFTSTVSEGDLRRQFGDANVVAGLVEIGEGQTEDGTTLFPHSPEDRVTLLWADIAGRRLPRWVSVRDAASRWRTPEGIGIGTALRSIERLNRRPFRLLGFHWDYGGTVMSWSGGRLEPPGNHPCWPRFRLSPAGRSPRTAEVSGDREFSSGHPAMQSLNPRVYEIFLTYRDRP